jgi:hypothetical protein
LWTGRNGGESGSDFVFDINETARRIRVFACLLTLQDQRAGRYSRVC